MAPSPASRHALVVRGGWFGHQPLPATDLFIPFLEDNGFTIRITDSPAIYADTGYMSLVDLIVQTNTMSAIAPEEVRGLRAAVAAGTGLGGWHGGITDSYRNSADYLQLIGGQFAAHASRPPAERLGEQEDNYRPHMIKITEQGRAHPITEGIEDFELNTEQYWVLTDGYLDVLATTTQEVLDWGQWNRRITFPAVWTRRWGAGRIFVSTPGHHVDILNHPDVNVIIKRGLLWAARSGSSGRKDGPASFRQTDSNIS
jgi:uncharacterized protein